MVSGIRWLMVVALAAAASAPAGAGARPAAQEHAWERRVPARPGERLTLELGTGGSVRVTGWDRDEVLVRAALAGRDWRGTRVEMARGADGPVLRARQEEGGRSYSTSHRFEAMVPRRYDLEVRSSGGEIRIEGVEGTFVGATGGGDLELERVRGRAELRTGGGAIRVHDARLSGDVRSGGGEVSLRAVRGGLRVNGVPAGGETARASAGDGPVVVRTGGGPVVLDEAPEGAVVATGGGAIRIRSARGRVHATTGGGSVTIDALDGGAEVRTGAGAVSVTLVGDPDAGERGVTIHSGSGAVTLTLPPGFGATFDVETGYTRAFGKRVQIRSDFPLQVAESSDWESVNRGTPRRYVRASGRVGDGRHRVVIRTVNGDVQIVRGSRD